MLPVERAFAKFALDLGTDLYRAVISDRDVFLLFCAGALAGQGRRSQGFAKALALYLAFRRLDTYMDVLVNLSLRRQHG